MTDAIDLNAAQIVNAPDVRNWPMTAAITKIWFDGSVSRFAFTKQDGPDRWPDVRPKDWTGDLQYTVWLFRNLAGVWVGSAFVQFWYGRDGSGNPKDPDVPSLYDKHWYYADRWAPLHWSGPIQPGEAIGFMITSGNQRDSYGPDSVQERSNVVLLPASDNATFTFQTEATPDSPVQPVEPPAPPPVPYGDLQDVLAELRDIKTTLGTVATKDDVKAAREELVQAVKKAAQSFNPFARREAPPKKAKKS